MFLLDSVCGVVPKFLGFKDLSTLPSTSKLFLFTVSWQFDVVEESLSALSP